MTDVLLRKICNLLPSHFGFLIRHIKSTNPFNSLSLPPNKKLNMPKIAIYKFLTFYIFAFDTLKEPPHLHVAKEKGNRQRSAKIWLKTLEVAEKGSLTDAELNQALKLIKENQELLIEAFNKVKAGKKVTTI